ncbi:Mitochondrial ribonuclease P protein 1 homolog [Sergentomyia squamirostris]
MYNLANFCTSALRILPMTMARYNFVRVTPHRKLSSLSKVQMKFPEEALQDPEREKKLKVLVLEMDVIRQDGGRAPDPATLTSDQWNHLLTLRSRSGRQKFYAFLWVTEKKKENEKRKREEEKLETASKRADKLKEFEQEEHIVYSLNYTSMFLRIYDTTMNHWHNNKLTRAMQFAPKVVLDCSYEEHMNRAESSNCAKQLMLTFAENRVADNPFDLHFCNVDLDAPAAKALHKHIPRMLDPDFPMNIHSKSYLDLFPHDRLVYLTPHCRNEMTRYNPDDVYIIGAMVDKRNAEPLSLAKAKRQQIRMAKLPLDKYLQWGASSGKSLTLNQMINILLTIKDTRSWDKALQAVPRRKIQHAPTQYEIEKIVKRLEDLKYNPRSSK